MCYICNCFSWTLDLIQRIITFALACLIAFAVCCGMSIAIIAGIAYGYNYSMAEFLTFTRSDVTVFMRRGHNFDTPDVIYPRRGRKSDEEDDILSMNITTDYPDNNVQNNSEPISYEYKWLETKDIRKYAEKLTKYTAKNPTIDEDLPEGRNYMKQTPSFGHISVTPIPGLATTVWQSGTSEIVMRIFRPMEQLPVFDNINSKDYGSIDKNEKTNSQKDAEKQIEDMEYVISANKIRLFESTEETNSFMPLSSTYKAPKVKDYPTEEMEEENIVYKPV